MGSSNKRLLLGIALLLLLSGAILSRGAFALEYILIKLNHRQADELVDKVKTLLTDEGEVTADMRTNSLLVVDRIENLEKVRGYIALVDRPSAMVRIQATFFNQSAFNDMSLGVNWRYSDDHFMVGNIRGLPWGKGLYLDVSPGGGAGKSSRLTTQELLIASGLTGDFITGKSVPTDERVIVYFRNRGIAISGVVFREVSTGFRVTPTVMGSGRIQIEIEPFISYFADGKRGEILFKEIRTTVVIAAGEDAVIASSDASTGGTAADILSGFSGRGTGNRYYFAINASIED